MEYKDIFVKVLINALKELTKIDFLFAELPEQNLYKSEKEITSQVSVFGREHEGLIILNLDRELVKRFYYNIEEEELEDDDFTVEDFCGELTNMIAGKFIDFVDLDVNISLPIISLEPVEYETLKKNRFDCFRFYDNQNAELIIYTYLAKI